MRKKKIIFETLLLFGNLSLSSCFSPNNSNVTTAQPTSTEKTTTYTTEPTTAYKVINTETINTDAITETVDPVENQKYNISFNFNGHYVDVTNEIICIDRMPHNLPALEDDN